MSSRVLAESALRVSDCVTELLRKQPFFGSLVLRLPLRPDSTRETLATDGHEIRYSPRWVADTDSHFIETAMARVVMACALKHHTRRGERDPERWQLASQLVTHALLRDAGFSLPPDAEAWEEVSVEQAYDRLPESGADDSGDAADASSGAAGADASADGEPSPDGEDEDCGDSDRFLRRQGPSGRRRRQPAQRRGRRRPRRGRPGPGRQRRRRRGYVRCSAQPRSFRHRGGHGCGRPRARRRRVHRGAGGHHRRGAGLGRGHAPGAQHRPRRGQGAGPGGGDDSGRPHQHARLANAAAPLHDRYGQTRLHLEPAKPPVHRLGPVPPGDAFRSDGDHRDPPRHLGKHLQLPRNPRELLDRGARGLRTSSTPNGSSSCRSTPASPMSPSTPARTSPKSSKRRAGAGRTSGPGSHGSTPRASSPRAACTSRTWSARATPRPSRPSMSCSAITARRRRTGTASPGANASTSPPDIRRTGTAPLRPAPDHNGRLPA